MNPLPTHIPLYYWANPPTLNTRQYIAQGLLVYPMKTVHTVQSFLDTFCQNGLQFRIICACKAVKGANRNRHSVITASWLNSPPPPPPTRTLVMLSLLYPPLTHSAPVPKARPDFCISRSRHLLTQALPVAHRRGRGGWGGSPGGRHPLTMAQRNGMQCNKSD